MNDNSRIKFYLDKTGFFAESAVILLALACVFRVIGCWGLWHDKVDFIMLLLLPVLCCVLLGLCIVLFGKKGFFLSFIPVLLGVVFFVYKALSFTSWVQTVLCILLYLVVAVIYTGTVFGWISTKWLLPPLFGLPFLYKVIVEDIPALGNTAEPVTFSAGMEEMSVLCMLAALFCVGMGLKKRQTKAAPAPAQTPAPAPQPVPAPQPAAPAPQPAAPAPQQSAEIGTASVESTPAASYFDEPYTPMLTLDPESAEEDGTDENGHE